MALLLHFRLFYLCVILQFNVLVLFTSTRRGCALSCYVVKSLFVASRGVAINESPRRLAA